MCFSFKVSFATFVFSWSSCIYLLNKGLTDKNRKSVIFLMIFSSMQASDAILWYTGVKKNIVNYLTTSALIPIILSLQVLYNVFIMNKNKNKFITAFTVFLIGYLFFRFNGYSRPLCNNKLASPIWASKELQLWELVLFATIVLYPNWKVLAFTVFLVFPSIFLLSGGGYGSLWCALANIVTIYYLYKF
tara:strand:- start:517 stop:1083 length:567 start_codon:yes stop_codon:yes gene_type:complete